MKLIFHFHDTAIKGKASKALREEIEVVRVVFESFLKKSPVFKKTQVIEANLSLCGLQKIRKLNREFRAKDKVTDVLSFQLHENIRPDGKKMAGQIILELGDVIICREIAKKQAKEFQITYNQELLHLLIHGLLHLLGYDHEVSLKEEKIMFKHEEELVKKVYQKIGYKNGRVS